jgi:hypothetical protein
MWRERALKVLLIVVGLIFCGLAYPLIMFVKQEPALAMMLSVYVTLGVYGETELTSISQMAPFASTPVLKIRPGHYFVLAAGCFLWALLIFGLWHLIV